MRPSFVPPTCFSQAVVVPSDRVVSGVKIRASASAQGQEIGQLKPGEQAKYLGEVPSWYRIEHPQHGEGFVSKGWTQVLTQPGPATSALNSISTSSMLERACASSSAARISHWSMTPVPNIWQRIQQLVQDIPFIVVGDFNQARDGRGKYHSSQSIDLLNAQLERNNLVCLTDEDLRANRNLRRDPKKGCCRHNIDHICVTKGAFRVKQVGASDHFTEVQELSDHNGVFVDLDLVS